MKASATRIARSVLSDYVDLRADGLRVAMHVLMVAREQMTCERTRAINALTALVRTVEFGVDARKSLSCSHDYGDYDLAHSVRGRHRCDVPSGGRAAGQENSGARCGVRDNRKSLGALVETSAPELRCRGGSRHGGCSVGSDRVVTCRSGAFERPHSPRSPGPA